MRRTASSSHCWARLASAAMIAGLAAGSALAQTGTPVCADCHDQQAGAFIGSTHGKAFAHDGAYADASCVSCHTGAEKHAASGEKADIVNPKQDAAASGACLTCHSNDTRHAFWRGSAHESAGLRCLDCHAIHAPQVVSRGKQVSDITDLCLTCHTAQRVTMNQRSRHPLREGKINCASCHNPHGSATEKLVKADSVNDLCYTCHQEMRGPFLWEHSPVREDCLTCHSPHGSNNDKLLVARASQLCESCHLQGRHQTVAGLDTSMWNSNRACLNCHSQIHGSNHPSGPLFQR